MKKTSRKQLLSLSLFGVILLITLFIAFHDWSFPVRPAWERIRQTGKVRLLTDNNANSYYIYRGEPTGFEYEMASLFAEYLDAELEVVVPGWNDLISSLINGRGDFIGAGLTVTEARKKVVSFAEPYMTVQQRIIHHKLIYGIDSVEELAGRTIHVRRGTSYQSRLEELQRQGIDLRIKLYDNLPTEELIRMVAERKITFTIADSNIALLNRRYFPDVRIGLPIHEEESLAWATRKEDRAFRRKMNDFFETIELDGTLAKLYEKYYGTVEVFDYFDLMKFHERLETRLPAFEKIIRKESKKAGLDWRLVAALVYQESHFNPRARSHTGVKGLMQVTLATAEEMGIDNRLDPQQSLKAGIRYLGKLYDRFNEIEDPYQRMLFAIGAYNIGYGHIRDAQNIARDEGLDGDKWSSMKTVLPYLMKRSYYANTRFGYARGGEAVRYVDRILTYYDILRKKGSG